MPEEKQNFCEDWMRRRSTYCVRTYFIFTVLYNVFAIPTMDLVFSDPYLRGQLTFVHQVGIGAALVIFFLFDRKLSNEWLTFGGLQLILNTGVILALGLHQSSGGDLGLDILLLQAWINAITAVSIISAAFRRPSHIWALYLQYVALIAWAWGGHPMGLAITASFAFLAIPAVILQHGIMIKALREACQEFETRRVLAHLARSHLDHEIDLARHIQESMSAPAQLELGPLRLECFRVFGRELGRDWIAVRPDGPRHAYAILCEARERGVQGALVLHAIQSLWAEDLTDTVFDPEAWLEKANRALFVLGKNQSHVVSLNLLHITSDTLTYWSAGHPGLFIVDKEDRGGQVVKRMGREGADLGISEHIFITRMDVPLKSEQLIFLGNRGAFADGPTSRAEDFLKLRTDLSSSGTDLPGSPSRAEGQALLVVSGFGQETGLRNAKSA